MSDDVDDLPDENAPMASDETETPSDAAEPDSGTPARDGRVPVIAMLVVAVLLAGLGIGFRARAHHLRSTSSAANAALADQAETTEVTGQVTTALTKVLSYSYSNAGPTQQAAAQLLTGDAAGQYKTLFAALQKKAPGEKLTLAAEVVVAGVKQLEGNTAQLLVFLDQSSTRASDKSSATSAAQLDVTAVKVNGSWKISELLPL